MIRTLISLSDKQGSSSIIQNLDKSIFEKYSWHEIFWDKTLEHKNHHVFLYKSEDHKYIGFVLFSLIIDETEILKIGVLEEYRKQSIGKKLMKKMIKYLLEQNIKSCFLEVRDDNFSAIEFYLKLGFKKISLRKKYYSKPVCDALIMKKEF